MKIKLLSLALVVLSLLGIFDAGYVSYETLANVVPVCVPPFQCGLVLNSQWSRIFGVPLAVYGLFFYTTVFAFAILNVMEVRVRVPVLKNVRNTLYALTTFGFFFSLYLVFLQQFVINAWCLWCLISAMTTTSLFVVGMWLRNSEKKLSVEK